MLHLKLFKSASSTVPTVSIAMGSAILTLTLSLVDVVRLIT